MRAAIYARYSSDRQREQSIADQVAACKAYCERKKWTITGVYSDKAKTGRTDNRKGLKAVIAAAREYDVLLVWKRDRLSRDRIVMADIRRKLKKHGATIESATETIPEGAEGVLLESLLDGLSEYYSRNLAENVMRGMVSNAEQCKPNGVSVYGYDIVGDRYVINESKARVVRRIFEIYANKINYDFDKEFGHLCGAKGSKFTTQTISKIVRNEKYRGVYKWGKIRKEGGMPRIIDDDTFYKAQVNLKQRKRRSAGYLLSGKLFYTNGSRVDVQSTKKANGKEYKYYVLNGVYFVAEWLEEEIAQGVADTLNNPRAQELIITQVLEEQKKMDLSVDLRENERALKKARKEYDNLLNMVLQRGYNAAISQKMDEIEQNIVKLEAYKPKYPQLGATEIKAILASMHGASAKLLIKGFVSRVEVDKENNLNVICTFGSHSSTSDHLVDYKRLSSNLYISAYGIRLVLPAPKKNSQVKGGKPWYV